MASELKPWRYEIKYGPDGEDSYSWVYDDHGAMVATMKTHKAEQIVDAMNTRPAPAATDTGLKTIGFVPPMFVEGKGADYNDIFRSVSIAENYTAVVTRSQAEELFAAKDAQIAGWTESGKLWTAEIRELQADNAAQTARIKELEEALDSDPSGSDLWRYWSRKAREASQKYVDEVDRAEALEAKLAAAEKALEPFAEAARYYSNSIHRRVADDAEPCGPALLVKHLRAARAVLGGKPS